MIRAARFDQAKLKGEAVVTPEGYIKADAIVTRCGIFRYKNPDGSIRKEYRCSDEVFNKDSLESMKMIPLTNGHPSERLVTADNSKNLAVGFTGETVDHDGDYVLSRLLITDAETVRQVLDNQRRELSLGYTVDVVPEKGVFDGEEYDFVQKNIRYNHLSLVDRARAGSAARIALDSDAIEIPEEEFNMAKVKLKIDAEEVMVDPSTKSHYEKLVDDMKNLSDEKARVEREMAMIQEELEKTQGERDSLKEKVNPLPEEDRPGPETIDRSPKMDSAEFRSAVKARVDLEKKAERVLDRDTMARIDSISDIELKKLVISKKSKMNLDGKSKAYVDAAFDVVMQESAQDAVKYKTQTTNVDRSAGEKSPEEARKAMINRMTNPRGK